MTAFIASVFAVGRSSSNINRCNFLAILTFFSFLTSYLCSYAVIVALGESCEEKIGTFYGSRQDIQRG